MTTAADVPLRPETVAAGRATTTATTDARDVDDHDDNGDYDDDDYKLHPDIYDADEEHAFSCELASEATATGAVRARGPDAPTENPPLTPPPCCIFVDPDGCPR